MEDENLIQQWTWDMMILCRRLERDEAKFLLKKAHSESLERFGHYTKHD